MNLFIEQLKHTNYKWSRPRWFLLRLWRNLEQADLQFLDLSFEKSDAEKWRCGTMGALGSLQPRGAHQGQHAWGCGWLTWPGLTASRACCTAPDESWWTGQRGPDRGTGSVLPTWCTGWLPSSTCLRLSQSRDHLSGGFLG